MFASWATKCKSLAPSSFHNLARQCIICNPHLFGIGTCILAFEWCGKGCGYDPNKHIFPDLGEGILITNPKAFKLSKFCTSVFNTTRSGVVYVERNKVDPMNN